MHKNRTVACLLLLLDLGLLVVAFNSMAWLRGILANNVWIYTPLLAPAVLMVTAFYLIDAYNSKTDMMSLDYTSEHIIAVFSAIIGTLLVTFTFLPQGYPLQQSRAVIVLGFLACIPISLAYRRVIYSRSQASTQGRSLLFIGDAESSQMFAQECARMGYQQPVRYASPDTETANPGPLTIDVVLGQIETGAIDIEAIVFRENNSDLHARLSLRLVDLYFQAIPTYTLELFHQVYWRKIPLYRLNQTWLFQEGFKIAREPVFKHLKRFTDVAISLGVLTVGAPLFFAIALAIWCGDRGPVLFCQARIGQNRVPFHLYKFRTMRPNDGTDAYTAVSDMRITRVGKFLRTYRLDELPQMLNVLFGTMSLIGPRAEWDKLVADYEQQIACYHFRHLVKPGITGWAQVNYPYGANLDDTLRKLEYDLYYIRHFSFQIDASIVLKTIHIMLFGKGR
jgi:exopolysaccharide biosynthesis polyprenyl glycosylphosphotransferase